MIIVLLFSSNSHYKWRPMWTCFNKFGVINYTVFYVTALLDKKPCNATFIVSSFLRSENSDYKRSGYDRGHLAAAGNHKGNQKHCEETFYLSNMAPQVGVGFNRDYWNKLEKHVRKLTKTYTNVYCCTGPLYLPR